MTAEIVRFSDYQPAPELGNGAREALIAILYERFYPNKHHRVEEIVDTLLADLWVHGFMVLPIEITPIGGDAA